MYKGADLETLVFGDLTLPLSTYAHTALDLIKWSNPVFVTNYRNHRSLPLEWNELLWKWLCHYWKLWKGCPKIRSVAFRTLCCKQHKPSKRHTLLIRKWIFLLPKLVDKTGAAEVKVQRVCLCFLQMQRCVFIVQNVCVRVLEFMSDVASYHGNDSSLPQNYCWSKGRVFRQDQLGESVNRM